MIERIIDFFSPFFEDWGYLIVGLATALENSIALGLIVPGETLLLLGGFFAGTGVLDPALVIIVALVGGVAGDNVGYLIGRRAGRPFLYRHGHRFFLRRERLLAAERFYARHGGKTVFLGRFVPVVRSFGAILAGVSHMRYWKFFAYDLVGAAIWAVGHTLIGFFVGEQYPRYKDLVDQAGWVIAALLVALIGLSAWRHRRRAAPAGADPEVKERPAAVEIKEGGDDAAREDDQSPEGTGHGDRRLPEVHGGGGGE